MTGDMETYEFDCKSNHQSYITTISFKNSDVEEVLIDRILLIALKPKLKVTEKIKEVSEDIANPIKMQHDFAALLKEPVGSDFIIESQDGEEFHVHRNVLSVHSEVFKAMLHEDMAESRTGRVKLVDVASQDLRIMIEYIYTSTISAIGDIDIPNIIMLADRYNLEGLRKLCDHILIDQLAPDTAVDIVILADRCDSNKVKNKALQYIQHHKKLFKGAKFEQVDNMALMKELCNVMCFK